LTRYERPNRVKNQECAKAPSVWKKQSSLADHRSIGTASRQIYITEPKIDQRLHMKLALDCQRFEDLSVALLFACGILAEIVNVFLFLYKPYDLYYIPLSFTFTLSEILHRPLDTRHSLCSRTHLPNHSWCCHGPIHGPYRSVTQINRGTCLRREDKRACLLPASMHVDFGASPTEYPKLVIDGHVCPQEGKYHANDDQTLVEAFFGLGYRRVLDPRQ